MKMKMSKNKTMLALVVVAALALCSVAVVAGESDSDAASTSNLTIVHGDLHVTSSTSDSYGIYDDSVVTIDGDASYSGTICFGTYNTTTLVFTPLVTLTLADVSNVVINYNAGESVVTISGELSGSVAISQGTIILGDSSSAYFAGTVSGVSSSVTVANIYGLELEAGTTDIISGTVTAGSQTDGATTPVSIKPTVTISGVSYMETFTIDDSAYVTIGSTNYYPEVTIADGATVSVGAAAQSYVLDDSDTFNLTLGKSTDTSSVVVLVVYNGKVVASYDDALNNGVASVEVLESMDLSKSYSLYVIEEYDYSMYYYQANLSFSVSTSTGTAIVSTNVSSLISSTSVLTTGTTDAATLGIAGVFTTTSTLKCDSTFENVYAVATDGSSYYTSSSYADGVITFSSPVVEDDTILVVMFDSTYGTMYTYYGVVSGDPLTLDPNTAAPAMSLVTEAAAHSILASETVTVSPSPGTSVLTVATHAILNVDGTLNVVYGASNIAGSISNSGTINVDGKISYQTVTTAPPLGGTVNAAYYMTGSTSPYTYTYTTLSNAMAASDAVYISGTLTITEDTVLTGTSSTSNRVTVLSTARVTIGSSSTSPTVSTDSVTTLVIQGNIDVSSGKLFVYGLTSDYGTTYVTADVLVIDSTGGTYTDVVTALNAAVSGNTVSLRGSADLSTSVSVKSGVTLDCKNNNLTVESGVTFTVDGKVINAVAVTVEGSTVTSGVSVSAGSIILNTTDFAYAGTFTLSGDLTFGSAYDNTSATTGFGVITVSGSGATINVTGKTVFDNAFAGTGSLAMTVSGSATFNAADSFGTVTETVNVTGTFTAADDMTVDKMIVGSSATVGANTSKTLTVSNLTVGTAPTALTQYTNGAKVNVTVGTYALVYGQVDSSNFILTTGSLVSTAYYLDTSLLFATVYADGSVAISAIADPAITGYNFYAWYSTPSLVDTKMISTEKVGDVGFEKVYSKLVLQTISVTLSYTQNGYWMVNGNAYSGGTVSIDWASSYSISFVANNGYELKDYALYVNGSAMPLGYEPSAGDVLTFNGTVNEKVTSEDTAMDITTILLIIITIVIVIMAIIIAMKLMRS